jgi:hypothetical protein
MRYKFSDFVDKKKRESIKQLELIEQLLKKNGFKTENFIESKESDDPYIFCFNPSKGTSFAGMRIYKIGNELAFRIQRESKTHPYGSAYLLPIEEMYHDFLTDEEVKEEEAAQKVIRAVASEVRRFFEQSAEAEKKEKEEARDLDASGNMLIKNTGTDYSSLIYNKG